MDKEPLLYDVVHDYIISENFASDTEGANKVMLRLGDELMQEIYERTMTASEKRKDTMLKKKYDDSDMKKNMQAQYGKEEGKKVYFATIRKQAMEGYKGTADLSKSHPEAKKKVEDKIEKYFGTKRVPGGKMGVKEEVEQVDEAKYEKGASDYGKTSIRNKRAFGKGGNARPPEERGAAKMLRRDAHEKRRFVKKNNKYGATNKPPVYGAPSDEFKKDRDATKESYSANPAQQAAIAIAKKERKQDLKVAEKKKMKEEIVTELSKNTLNNYVRKADDGMRSLRASANLHGREKAKKKIVNREKGMDRAYDKLTKEEVVTELNRFEKEKGVDTKTGKPVTKGGTAKNDKAFQFVMKKFGKQRMGANQPKKVRGAKNPNETSPTKQKLTRMKAAKASSRAFETRAKKAGYKTAQDYANVVARYGSEDNMKKGRGLGT